MELGELDYVTPASLADRSVFFDEIEQFLDGLGIEHYSYTAFGSLQAGDVGSTETFNLTTNFQSTWQDRYRAKRYDQIDPVIEVAKKSRAPFLWGSSAFLKRFRKRQLQVFHEAREFGVAHGLTIPINSKTGIELVTFTSRDNAVMRNVFSQYGGKLIVAAHHIADTLCALEPDEDKAQKTVLTPRERESLIWVAEGLTSEEIAEKMCISSSGVNYHLGNAAEKLAARNRHHAALLALKKNWI